MFKQITRDALSAIAAPSKTFASILETRESKFNAACLLFLVIMNTYWLFLPSSWLVLNLMTLPLFIVAVGMMYYFSQECFILFQENFIENNQSTELEKIDGRYFYTIAYCFALANVPALIYSIIINYTCIIYSSVFFQNPIIGMAMAAALNLPALFLSLIYSLKALKAITKQDSNLPLFMDVIWTSFLFTAKEWLGLRAIRDIFIDLSNDQDPLTTTEDVPE